MKNTNSILNHKKNIDISSKNVDDKLSKIKEKISKKNQKLKSGTNDDIRYNTLNINDSPNIINEQNYNTKEFELEKIKPKNLLNFNSRNNNNTIKLEKKFIKLYDNNSNSFINQTENKIHNIRKNRNNTQLLNGGNNEKLNIKLVLKNKNPVKLRKMNTNLDENYFTENNDMIFNDKNLQTITALNTISPKEVSNIKSDKERELIDK